jgi:hypothetical protein
MHHLAVVAVTAFVRTKNCGVRKPVRIGQVTTLSVVRIEGVAAMYAGLDLRLGSHIGQGTRDDPKSVLISDRRRTIDVSQNAWCAIQSSIGRASELIIF